MAVTNPNLEALIRSLRPTTVTVVGDVMLDRYVRGAVRRLSPEAPIQVLESMEEFALPGGAANVAMKAADLGRACISSALPATTRARRNCALVGNALGNGAGLIDDPARVTTVKSASSPRINSSCGSTVSRILHRRVQFSPVLSRPRIRRPIRRTR